MDDVIGIIVVLAVLLIIGVIWAVYSHNKKHRQIIKEIEERKRKDKEQRIAQARQNARENQEVTYSNYEVKKQQVQKAEVSASTPKRQDSVKMLSWNFSNRSNFKINYPKELCGSPKTLDPYERVKVDTCINWEKYYNIISLSEPISFSKKDDKIEVYQNDLQLGTINSARVAKVISNCLSRDEVVLGFITKIFPEENELKISIGYYLKPNENISESVLKAELKSNAEIDITLSDGSHISAPLTQNGMEIYDTYEKYSICVITTKEPDYSKLKLGGKLTLVQEPNNRYDHKAVKFKQGNRNVGYLYSHNMQDEANEFLTASKIVEGYLTQIDLEDRCNKLKAAIIFYK